MKTGQSCVETPQILREVKDPLLKPARGDKDAPEKQDEGKYVDLELVDVKARGAKRAEDSDERQQKSVRAATEPNHEPRTETQSEAEGRKDVKCAEDVQKAARDPSASPAPRCVKSEDADRGERAMTQLEVSKHNDNNNTGRNEDCPDVSRRSEEEDREEEDDDDDVSLVLSDGSVPCVTEDESHYITTHEIQLSELSDHEGDCEPAAGSSASWDIEDNNQLYSFVDYASFAGDGAAVVVEGESTAVAAAVSTLLESDLCSDESASKLQQRGGGGQIHLSIRTTSRTINERSNIQENENIVRHAARSGDVSRCVFRGVDGKADALCDRAKCFIAAPGRLHFGRRLRGKEVTEYSSGASSAVSELDDADKEVRNLTAKSFKSLAYPYCDAIHFSTSSESSASERAGLNRWSTFVDLQYGNMNASQGLVPHQHSAASLETDTHTDSRGYKGGKPLGSRSCSSAAASAKKIELLEKFAQGHSGGVIRLTETLNFRCNVTSGMSAGERRANCSQNAAGSRSADEVTDSSPGTQRRGAASKPTCRTMEDTHKKAIFASSVIKNVISKKMQFEQERKMERGEISESPCCDAHGWKASGGGGELPLQAHSSKLFESSSDYTIMCAHELGDFVDSGSCDARSDSRRRNAAAETNLEPTNEAGNDTKKGALDASRGTLLRSQNSAFRCWKDEELEFQKDHKNDQSPEDEPPSTPDRPRDRAESNGGSKLTKMSHLFVPSIQRLSGDGGAAQQQQQRQQCGDAGAFQLRADNTLYIAGSRSRNTSKSPEIKINLRSVRDSKTEPFGVSRLRATHIGCNATAGPVRTDDFTCQALAAALKGESSDRVPHFTVRDIRDNKGKLQTPIHHVRDVRKLVKSSYHFVSLDNNENKSAETHAEQKKLTSCRQPASVSPIVIKCQSVNTNSHGKQSEHDVDGSSPAEGAKAAAAAAAAQRPAGRVHTSSSSHASDGGAGLRTDSRAASKRPEKPAQTTDSVTDKKPESKMANRAALEKLQAAVKTMEQLYVFERNEWKRKNEPRRLTDSHVLSLITSEELGGPEEEDGLTGSNADVMPVLVAEASPNIDSLLRQDDKDLNKVSQTSRGRDDRLVAKSKNMFSLSSSLKTSANTKTPQPNVIMPTPFSAKSFVPKSPKLPVSLKISRPKPSGEELENENYLTIPVKTHAGGGSQQASSAEKTSVYTFSTQSTPPPPPVHASSTSRCQEDHHRSPQRSSIVMETRSPEIPSATIYHSLPMGVSTGQPQVYCFSPAITPSPSMDPYQATQRKMLLDPSTGNYYLVDTPVQPATRRLFDPETGQYVEVPMPQPPMTPVPVPMSPLALGPGAYGHTYMIYPGFMPTPSVIPARTLVQSQMSVASEEESGEKVPYMESPFYMTTGRSAQAVSAAQQQASTTAGRPPPAAFSSIKQPLISITSQQGPRIIAPPSFDGTTMSFVVEHR